VCHCSYSFLLAMARAAAAVCAQGAIAGLQPVLHMLLAYVAFLRGKARRMAWHGMSAPDLFELSVPMLRGRSSMAFPGLTLR
jgi:hypothetical protein